MLRVFCAVLVREFYRVRVPSNDGENETAESGQSQRISKSRASTSPTLMRHSDVTWRAWFAIRLYEVMEQPEFVQVRKPAQTIYHLLSCHDHAHHGSSLTHASLLLCHCGICDSLRLTAAASDHGILAAHLASHCAEGVAPREYISDAQT